jgi:hypothetical protein
MNSLITNWIFRVDGDHTRHILVNERKLKLIFLKSILNTKIQLKLVFSTTNNWWQLKLFFFQIKVDVHWALTDGRILFPKNIHCFNVQSKITAWVFKTRNIHSHKKTCLRIYFKTLISLQLLQSIWCCVCIFTSGCRTTEAETSRKIQTPQQLFDAHCWRNPRTRALLPN